MKARSGAGTMVSATPDTLDIVVERIVQAAASGSIVPGADPVAGSPDGRLA